MHMCIHTYRHVSGFGGVKSLRPDLDGRDAGAPGCVCVIIAKEGVWRVVVVGCHICGRLFST